MLPYQIYQEAERERAAEELKAIINKPTLLPQEIWEITEENFYIWRAKHDYPRILQHFSNRLTGFEDWKKENKLDEAFLKSYGISNCINPNPARDKRKYVIEETWDNQKRKYISYQNIHGRYYNLGPKPVNHRLISTFVGYIDWCNFKGIKIMKDWIDNGIITRPAKSHPVGLPPAVEVSILDGLKLLKIGGIEIKPDSFGLIKPKYFEFVNADYLTLSGRIATAGRQLTFENSFIDNLICEDVDLAMVQFRNSSVRDFLAGNSSLQQWDFNFCGVNGKAYNTEFRIFSIYGGYFSLDFKDCTFDQVDARQASSNDLAYENTYRTFKKVYADQGNDKKAIEYFLFEKSMERQRIKQEIFAPPPLTPFSQTKKERLINTAKHALVNGLKFIAQWINNFYWGYGRKPLRVVRNSIGLIVLFSFVYFFEQKHIHFPEGQTSMSLWDSFYFSTVTFTTLGYGDFTPLGPIRIVTAIEACMGGLSFGFLVAAFSNFKY